MKWFELCAVNIAVRRSSTYYASIRERGFAEKNEISGDPAVSTFNGSNSQFKEHLSHGNSPSRRRTVSQAINRTIATKCSKRIVSPLARHLIFIGGRERWATCEDPLGGKVCEEVGLSVLAMTAGCRGARGVLRYGSCL